MKLNTITKDDVVGLEEIEYNANGIDFMVYYEYEAKEYTSAHGGCIEIPDAINVALVCMQTNDGKELDVFPLFDKCKGSLLDDISEYIWNEMEG